MRKATITNMRERVDLARMHIGSTLRALECERSNPQVEIMFQRLSAKLEAFNAVQEALNGNPVMLALEYHVPRDFSELDAPSKM